LAPDTCSYRAPTKIRTTLPLSRTAKVTWDAPNSITLFRWEDTRGDAQTVGSPNGEIYFRWQNQEQIPPLHLLVPAAAAATFAFDGMPLTAGQNCLVFDEAYLVYDLPNSGSCGDHMIVMKSNGIAWTSPCYLEGEFDCTVEPEGEIITCFVYYNFKLDIPKRAKITLKKRRTTLMTHRSWADQGHAFYSGSAVYSFEFTIPQGFRHPVLRLNKVHCSAELTVNGVNLGSRIFPPFDFDLKGFPGTCQAELRIENTLGNRLDGYGAPSGLAAEPELLDVE
jgi:hypothetical protein